MLNAETTKMGVLASFKAQLDRNRLGDLLVNNGQITDLQLSDALRIQKMSGLALGEVLREQGLISGGDLRVTLAQQMAWRGMAAALAFVIGFSALGIHSARATSAMETGGISRPEISQQVQPAAVNRRDIPAPANQYPALFGTAEVRSADISPFTKWTGVMARLNDRTAPMPQNLAAMAGQSEQDMIRAVNAHYNKVRYIEDKNNWGTSDYWETPVEFTSRGGDCEDFAIAKYAALKNLGFTEDQMRIAIVRDTWKGIPHAILIVYTADGAKFLDNQYKEVKNVAGFDRYAPVYSINRTGWWRHV